MSQEMVRQSCKMSRHRGFQDEGREQLIEDESRIDIERFSMVMML